MNNNKQKNSILNQPRVQQLIKNIIQLIIKLFTLIIIENYRISNNRNIIYNSQFKVLPYYENNIKFHQ